MRVQQGGQNIGDLVLVVGRLSANAQIAIPLRCWVGE